MEVIIDNSAELVRLGDTPAGGVAIRQTGGDVLLRIEDYWISFGAAASPRPVPVLIPLGDLDHEEQVQQAVDSSLTVKTD